MDREQCIALLTSEAERMKAGRLNRRFSLQGRRNSVTSTSTRVSAGGSLASMETGTSVGQGGGEDSVKVKSISSPGGRRRNSSFAALSLPFPHKSPKKKKASSSMSA